MAWSPTWKSCIARETSCGRIGCLLAIVFSLGLSCKLSECCEGPVLGGGLSASELPSEEQRHFVTTRGRKAAEPEILDLKNSVAALIEGNDVVVAEKAQRQLVSLLETVSGKADWETRNERTFLIELERAHTFAEEKRRAYLVARQRYSDAVGLMEVEDYDSAEPVFRRVLLGLSGLFDDNCPTVAASLECLGVIYLAREDCPKAKDYLVRSALARKRLVGEDHPDYANAMVLVGLIHLGMKDFKQAEVYLRDGLTRNRKCFGVRSVQYAKSLGHLTEVLIRLDKLPEVEALSLQAVSILEDVSGADCPYLAYYLRNLGDVHVAYGEYESAERRFRRSMAIYQSCMPPWDPSIAIALERLTMVLEKLDRHADAKAMAARAEAIRAQHRATSVTNRTSSQPSVHK